MGLLFIVGPVACLSELLLDISNLFLTLFIFQEIIHLKESLLKRGFVVALPKVGVGLKLLYKMSFNEGGDFGSYI